MFVTILITVSVTLWCLFSFALYGYHYLLEVILDLPIIGESPCTANSALKLIIQKIIREANDLPKLKNEGSSNAVDEDKRTYENLLSAAILNKIISNSQNNISVGTSSSSRANSVCSHKSSSSRRNILQKEYFFGEETLDNKWKNIDTDTASVSSLEEWVHSDSSLGSTKYVDRISLTIKQRIEEVSSSESDQDEEPDEVDDAEYFRSNSSFSNNEPNWFLKRRQFRAGTISPVPVPMLVPNPTIEAKVLIGDKEVDDTSDLSDVPSDFEDEKTDPLVMDVKNHLIGSKSIIGGKNPLADLSLVMSDDDVSADSGVKECKDLDDVDSEVYPLSKKHINDYSAEGSVHSDGSNNERDLEYTERYATLPRQILISPKDNKSEENDYSSRKTENDSLETEDLKEEKEYEFAGLYSKREKQKWKQAVELKNNPYSKENIEKRIKSRNSINSLFGSDYYIRQACLPSGAKKSEIEKTSDTENLSEDQKISEIGLEDHENNDELNISEPASPINLDETLENSEELQHSNSIENMQEISDPELQFCSVMTSDSELSLVNCYNVSQSVIYKKVSADNEEIQSAEQFLDCESLEDPPNITEEIKEEFKPVAKPRKRLKSENNLDLESQSMKGIKSEETNDEGFNAIPYVINKRSDNTLIKKIYSNPSVRLFALNNRNKLPISIEDRPVKKPVAVNRKSLQKRTEMNEDDTNNNNEEIVSKQLHSSTPIKEKTSKNEEFHKEILVNGNQETLNNRLKSETIVYNKSYSLDCDALDEINKLKEQKLVASRLKEFSKSFINLSEINDNDLDEVVSFGFNRQKNLSVSSESEFVGRRLSGLQSTERSASVKDLMKKFEQFEDSGKVEKPILYSLTGRSISKQFKEKLRDLDEQPSLSQIQSLSLTDVEVVENAK